MSCKNQKEDWVKLSLEVDFGSWVQGGGAGGGGLEEQAERQLSRQRYLPCKPGNLHSISGSHVKMRRKS